MPDVAADRQQAAWWAKTVIECPDRWLILDTETTGLDGDDEIVQVAAIQPDGVVLLDSLVKPTCEISAKASEIHGIYAHHVESSPTFDQVFLQLLKVIGRKRPIIYNASFDLRLIQQSLRPHNICISIPYQYWINGSEFRCAMEQYAQWIGDWSDYHQSYRWQRLPGGDHTALGDCFATLEVIRRMAASFEPEPIETAGAKLVEMPTIAAAAATEEYDDIPF